ncbi:hypothetical protein [Undibacterium parvum]|jgi:hypothetical protein|uniref:Uncharacterized protein n=2 Tax=Undibacterium TaxID=401469 RepID=A0A6M4A2B7_9BURK|nr:hypothetical protein [Undibacterium parvum]AZP10920.1 hypothetical protein EJN92_02140 [Undibacterium parvum]QJQ05496.1 hypothetical protein EJG51_006130 [Undibacterium piscinae]
MLNHDGYEFREANKKQYRYKGLIDITPKSVNWTADISLNDVQKGAIKGSLMGIGEDEGPVRRAVDVAVKAAIQSYKQLSD